MEGSFLEKALTSYCWKVKAINSLEQSVRKYKYQLEQKDRRRIWFKILSGSDFQKKILPRFFSFSWWSLDTFFVLFLCLLLLRLPTHLPE